MLFVWLLPEAVGREEVPAGGFAAGAEPSCAVPLAGAGAPGWLWAIPGFAADGAGSAPWLGAFVVVPVGGVLPVEVVLAVLPGAEVPVPPPLAGGGEEGAGFGPGAAEPLLGRLVFRLPEEGVFPPPVRLAATVCTTVWAAWFAIMVGSAIKPCPRGLPVWAGFSPIRQTISSIFLPTRTMAVTKISQGKIPGPLGTVLIVESSSFKKITFISIITHILPNILHHPLKISSVFLLPPMPMLMYGKEASNRKQEIDRQHHTIPNQRNQGLKDKHCGNVHNRLFRHG
ncbi:hypothetical protein [Anaerotruncus colihominis]|uniref:hypothetical protein n=1 Tax=Anaerotruncus colihominis TaxID=169435 RepID=UPI001363D090|nr:hypothetical protein [Anaerotruncus colihominis]